MSPGSAIGVPCVRVGGVRGGGGGVNYPLNGREKQRGFERGFTGIYYCVFAGKVLLARSENAFLQNGGRKPNRR